MLRIKELIYKYPLQAVLALLVAIILVLGIWFLAKRYGGSQDDAPSAASLPPLEYTARLDSIMLRPSLNLYGLQTEDLEILRSEIQSGETFSKLLNGRYGVDMSVVNRLVELCKGKFDLRKLRAGNSYTAMLSSDSSRSLCHLVYESDTKEFITFSTDDSIYVKVDRKEVVTKERYVEGVIKTSLYGTMYENGINPDLAGRLSEIFQSTIDFFGLQKGDSFHVLYEEEFIDGDKSIGIGKIYGTEFIHAGKSHWGIRFSQGDDLGYWDLKGGSLRRALLIAPLSFKARVSSKFGTRIHPIRRVRQQHNGIDYAAPSGTPVMAVGNGVVVKKGWDSGGGGNMIRIRHTSGVESGYLHLRGFAKGISVGSRVQQSQIIGYVGSTGMSTGPHLDFRIWVKGRPVDPAKNTSAPSPPINAKYKGDFDRMKEDVLKVMDQYAKTTASSKQ